MGQHRRNSGNSDKGSSHHEGSSGGAAGNGDPAEFDRTNGPWPCGVAKGQTCVFGSSESEDLKMIRREDVLSSDAVRVTCTNERCPMSPFMHLACFTTFEEAVLVHLRNQGRARGWSEKQRSQNLWSKRGYDLVFKACECSCDHGFLRKDLDWVPPWGGGGGQGATAAEGDALGEEANGARRKRKKSKCQNKITIGLPTFSNGIHENHQDEGGSCLPLARSEVQNVPNAGASSAAANRNRANSLCSSTSSGSSFVSCSPSALSTSPGSNEGGAGHLAKSQQPPRRAMMQDRSRHDSGGSIFQHRHDYSSFNVLPKHKVNSYHIKMEDECSIGNDETRIFILSSYASNKMNRVPCVLCKNIMYIFDRYPLIDGTFFLSPRQHSNSCIKVKCEGKTSYMTAVCMACLEGWTGNGIVCRYCLKPWTGGHLILGTMYSYDIFAAMPCCQKRFQCNTCGQLVCHPEQPFNFFSDYSQMVSCPQCGTQEAHFAKPLSVYTTRDEANKQMQMQAQAMSFQQQQHQALRVHRVNSA